MVVGSTGAGPIVDAIEVFRRVTKKPPNFVDISEAKAMAERFAIYDEAEISVGAFGGSPAVPSDKVQTISANLLLVSQPSLANHVAGDLTRVLLATKAKVATTLPEAGQLSAPSTDNDELLPVHPGTVAFLNGTQTSTFDDPTNVILLISMLIGLPDRWPPGSGAAKTKIRRSTPDAAAAACAGRIKKYGPRAAQCIGAGARRSYPDGCQVHIRLCLA
jgi:hypothetical protein